MEIDLSYLTNILTRSPGNLLYHLVISLSLVLLCGLALPKVNREILKNHARQLFIGCAIILIIQLILFSASLVKTLTPITLALLESLASTLTAVWVIWLFHEDDSQFFLTGVNIFLTLALMITASTILIMVLIKGSLISLDLELVIISWQFGTLLLIALGLVFTIVKHPPQSVILICILLMLAAGHSLEIFYQDMLELKFGAVRLAQMVSLPWTIAILQRFGKSKPVQVTSQEESPVLQNQKRVDTKPLLVDYLLKVSLQETQQEKHKAIARALSMSVLSDICCLFEIDKNSDKIELLAGYDLIREVFIPPTSVSSKSFQNILNSWRENRVLKLSRLYSEGIEVQTLTEIINYPYLGNVLAYPLPSNTDQLAGGAIFLTPYTNKTWDEKTTALLDEIKPTLSQIIFTPIRKEDITNGYNKVKSKIQELLIEKEALEDELSEKERTIQKHETALRQLKAKNQIEKIESMNQIRKLQDQITQLNLKSEVKQDRSTNLEQMRDKIRQLTKERDQLRSELEKTDAKLQALKTEKGQTGPIRLSLDTQVVSLDSIMANVRLMIAPRLAEKNIDLDIVNSDGHQLVKMDPELTQTVLFGLLDNAIKASRSDSKIQVSQELFLETGMLVIQVTDYGEGLTPEEQSALFSTQPEMTPGIGSIQAIRDSIRAIRVLNGKIWLKSKKGAFTTFRVQLPVRIID